MGPCACQGGGEAELVLVGSTPCARRSRRDGPACGHRLWQLSGCGEELLMAGVLQWCHFSLRSSSKVTS